ncbi:MAG TPA: MBOAT family O-acyltransferase [Erysipelothrix sp.]
MLFSSITFLYFFLPLSLLVYHGAPIKFKNSVIVLFSLLFFYLGEPNALYLLITVASLSYFYGVLQAKLKPGQKHLVFVLTLIALFALLFYFKYFDFFILSVNTLFKTNFNLKKIALPLGISFYIFQASSYVIDVYREDVQAERNLINYFAYLTFFPQLIAGPIVRYQDVQEDVQIKHNSLTMIESGILRFVLGLGKKVLLANALGQINQAITGTTGGLYWLSALTFTLQLYFDFSGYSDMAIGMGQMFGIQFLENFNYPFMATSVSDFWRRWHISLGVWFKKYIYIPLGGNRVSLKRLIFNLAVVWFLTGLWHGAAFNFIVWGFLMWVMIVLEKVIGKKDVTRFKYVNITLTFIFIVLSFVIFKNDSLAQGLQQIKIMLNPWAFNLRDVQTRFMWRNHLRLVLFSLILATPLVKNTYLQIKSEKVKTLINVLFVIGVMLLSTASLVNESYNPFLYFRF